ncbi:osmosensing histidine protein kinase SLN1 [Xylaria sp. CBS 124048]|nr:osmosensing histidine protein kinase SLN1 [Xylaria sp. CBS 124048]
MRIAIREQLAALVLLVVLLALTIVSVPTWIYVRGFVVDVESGDLSLTASLKAAQIASQIQLIQTTCMGIATRLLVQGSFLTFYRGNNTTENWLVAEQDLQTALNAGGASNLLQAKLFSRNETGDPNGLANVTAAQISDILLPYKAPDGSPVFLGNTTLGYPPSLYPNITYYTTQDPDPLDPGQTVVVARPFPDIPIDGDVDGLLLGPLVINQSYALISLTLPVRMTSDKTVVLGYMTIVAEATPLIDIINSPEGLGNTGAVLLIGPATKWNRFNEYTPPAQATTKAAKNFSDVDVHFVLPPPIRNPQTNRHTKYDFDSGNFGQPFKVLEYNAAYKAFTDINPAINNASSILSTTNEQGIAVAVGYARPPTQLVSWTLMIEQARSEAFKPIVTLQYILLGTVFGTAGVVLLFIVPCAHLGVQPIRRLKAATEKSIAPPGYVEPHADGFDYDEDQTIVNPPSQETDHGILSGFKKWYRSHVIPKAAPSDPPSDARRRVFKIPGKVVEHRHVITDELTELSTTFNEMSDELFRQYTLLEDKVAQRTRELEESKKAAEAANESKTLFIANISHELKTPLNGILGMASICMEEDDLGRIKQSLNLLYKSGDLLSHLLEDLLSFSKNQIGRQLKLDEKEFWLGDLRLQVLSIFDKQARDGQISFSVELLGTDAVEPNTGSERNSSDEKPPVLGPRGTGRLKDMCLWGDQHRILQVLINLVGNSLKFTPAFGKVSVRIRCGEVADGNDDSRTSSLSKNTSSYLGKPRQRGGSGSNTSMISRDTPVPGTALSINPLDPKVAPYLHTSERTETPPPVNAKQLMFEFEVEDTGPGIPEHMQTQVFEPFVQGDPGLSKKFGGTGLGLSICQQLANIMGGTIAMRSTVGVGTIFTMRIPLKYIKDRSSTTGPSSIKSPQSSVITAESELRRPPLRQTTTEAKSGSSLDKQHRLIGLSQPFFAGTPNPKTRFPADQIKAAEKVRADKGGGKLRVLVAEDNPTNIEVVSRMLKLEDVYDVTIAKDGQEAYDLVKDSMEKDAGFDLIFMDIQMPNVDGLQSTRLIRDIGYSAPIVALTAFSDESNVKNCIDCGMDEFLSKPIRRPALKRVLKKFSTILEEPETTSPSGAPLVEKATSLVTSQPLNGCVSPVSTDSEKLVHPNVASAATSTSP